VSEETEKNACYVWTGGAGNYGQPREQVGRQAGGVAREPRERPHLSSPRRPSVESRLRLRSVFEKGPPRVFLSLGKNSRSTSVFEKGPPSSFSQLWEKLEGESGGVLFMGKTPSLQGGSFSQRPVSTCKNSSLPVVAYAAGAGSRLRCASDAQI
jgi:hypothetical protein